ncbi:MAG: protein-disulfide reductase DsbD [Pseudomonadota bacterium]
MIKKILTALLLLLLPAAQAVQTGDDLLEADQAFRLSTRVVNPSTLEASWKIAPGYYLYRDKFKFEVLDGAVVLNDPVLPAGKKKQDPLFGLVETYTKSVKVSLPFKRTDSAPTTRLRITAQGCNEPVGVCYPPIVKEVNFTLPPPKINAAPRLPVAPPVTEFKSFKELTRASASMVSTDETVDPEKAFTVSVSADKNALLARIDIADCCYLYRDKTRFELTRSDGSALPEGVRLGKHTLPTGKTKTDEFIGKTEVYNKGFEVWLPVEGVSAQNLDLMLHVSYQGCAEKGVAICYPPNTKKFHVTAAAGMLAVTAISDFPARSPADTNATTRDHDELFLAILAAFGAGLLLTFTPCVLPMVPILSGIIVGTEGTHLTKLRGGLLSYSYVLGTSLTYTVAGAVAGATGDQLQAYFQTPWAIGTFATLLVLLSLSMFGFYQLQVPSSIQSLLHHHSTRMHHQAKQWFGGELIGAFILGLVSALIIGACVSPVLVSVLGVAIAAKDPVLGGAIMFALAHGQGMILIAIGIGAGFLLPKFGKWMDSVKHLFGVLLLAVAIYLLSFLPQVPVLFLWAMLLIVSAVYLGATQGLPANADGWRYFWKGIGTFLLLWGVAALLGGFAGNRDILHPLPLPGSGVVANTAIGTDGTRAAASEHLFDRARTLREVEDRLAAAKASGKPVILDYYADWCTDCVRMEKGTLADPRVREALKSFVLIQADVTQTDDTSRAVKKKFSVYGPPAMLFFGANGEERQDLRAYGYRTVDEFLTILKKL